MQSLAVQPTLTPSQQRALTTFDTLPDGGMVDVQVVAALCGFSVATAWRLTRKGDLPTPVRLTAGTTRWRVGALRQWLTGAGVTSPTARVSRNAAGVFAGTAGAPAS